MTSEPTTSSPRAWTLPWSHGWNILAVSLLFQAVSFGIVIYSFTFWVEPWVQEFNAPRSTILLGITLLNVGMGAAAPFAGRAVDRLPVKYLVCAGATCFAAGLTLSSAATALWQILILYATLIPIGLALCGPLAAQTLATRWFPDRQGFAIGLSTLGTSIGGFILPPIATKLLDLYGWRVAQFDLGVAALIILLPAVWLVIRDPERSARQGSTPEETANPGALPTHTKGSASHTFRQRNFWVIVGSFLPLMMVTTSIHFNMAPHANDIGLQEQTTATIVSLMALVMIGGKLGFGYFADRVDHRILFWIMIALTIVAVILFRLASSAPSFAVASLVFGVALGGILPLIGALVARCFGSDAFGSVMGLLGPFFTVAAIGPVITGMIRDTTGSYTLAFTIMFVVFVPSSIAIYFLRPPPSGEVTPTGVPSDS